jgi:hypothetical protein
MSWLNAVRESSATQDQKRLIEQLVEAEIRELRTRVLVAQGAHAKCICDWAEWVEKVYAELDGMRASLRGDDGSG